MDLGWHDHFLDARIIPIDFERRSLPSAYDTPPAIAIKYNRFECTAAFDPKQPFA